MRTVYLIPALVLQLTLPAATQDLESQLLAASPAELAEQARQFGDAQRGAVVFYQAMLACTRCHTAGDDRNQLGPDLTALGDDATDQHLIESVLQPSKAIREGYEPVTVSVDGVLVSGLLVSEDEDTVVLRDSARDYKQVSFARSELDGYRQGELSIMPAGMTNLLASKQQFLDLTRYLFEIRDGGSARARELEPDPALYAARPLPEYEANIDHAGFLRDLDREAFDRGRKIYERTCANCHGTHDQEGSLPTSLRFASQPFKNGNDPHTLYQTLTSGFGMMAAQTWMVPSQKYDVIHYLREAYLKDHNPTQYRAVDEDYLASLPAGTERGPAPSATNDWQQMDYGPSQVMTLEVGKDGTNFAYKGNAIRLDAGPGGVSQGRYWMLYDYDTMRVAAAWSGEGFIDWNSIHFNGRHAIHPRVAGEVHLSNPTGPGWGRPSDGSFEDERLIGRDQRRYGPLDRSWAQYRGMYYHGPDTIMEYTVGTTRVLEMPGVLTGKQDPTFTRTMNLGPRTRDLVLQVAHLDDAGADLATDGTVVWFGQLGANDPAEPTGSRTARLDGSNYFEVKETDGMNVGDGDFTLYARIRTEQDGTLVALTGPEPNQWVRDGLTWFVRGGRLTVDIGWVGAFQGQQRVADGMWHDVAVTYEAESGRIQFFVDGVPEDRVGELRREAPLDGAVLRIGFTTTEFPGKSPFEGTIQDLRIYNEVLGSDMIASDVTPAGHWPLTTVEDGYARDLRRSERDAKQLEIPGAASTLAAGRITVAGVEGDTDGVRWYAQGGDLRLHVPAGGDARNLTLWFGVADDRAGAEALTDSVVIDNPTQDLEPKTQGGPSRWGQPLESVALVGADEGPFAVDVLKRPTNNPWFCRMRLTGFDFTDGGDTAIVSAWDGSIWRVTGLGALPDEATAPGTISLHWRRIASGLFQPLGVKIIDGEIYVTCRDQIVILHDLDGDEEIDWYECFNNDHQVTEHFHEFAMGLQTDADGNLLYAKSARHAKTALVPHHGTLLRVSKDGQHTEIVASGFRAANGVCLNPDGTFIVTGPGGSLEPEEPHQLRRGGRLLREHVRLPRRDRRVGRGHAAAAGVDHQRVRPFTGRAALGGQ